MSELADILEAIQSVSHNVSTRWETTHRAANRFIKRKSGPVFRFAMRKHLQGFSFAPSGNGRSTDTRKPRNGRSHDRS